MTRRTFITTVPVAAAGLLAGCSRTAPDPGRARAQAGTGWNEDVRMRTLRLAVLAPSSHNAQPWIVDLSRPSTCDLYVDPRRLLPRVDPVARQTHVSQGTFLELMDIAARELGQSVTITGFPDGTYGPTVVEPLPVARVTFGADGSVTRDPLFAAIAARHTNKRPFDLRREVTSRQWAVLASAVAASPVTWRRVTAAAEREALTRLLTDAMTLEVASPDRNRETAEWFRFSDRELTERRDGFGLANNGASGVQQWVAERFLLSRSRAADPAGMFARGAISSIARQAGSAPAFAALVTTTNTRSDQVLAGRAYARVHLAATAAGLQVHPFSQALQEYPEMLPLQRRLKSLLGVDDRHTIQMLFRLGSASDSVRTPRRDPATMVHHAGVSP